MKNRLSIERFTNTPLISDEISVDPDITELLTQVREVIETFKETYTEVTDLCKMNIEDYKSMTPPHEISKGAIASKLFPLKRQLSTVHNLPDMLKVESNIRIGHQTNGAA
jgi:hypothetical protein